ncbi:MAG: DUF4116 domain-containing protein, partial [Fusobacteriaceae bacterium]
KIFLTDQEIKNVFGGNNLDEAQEFKKLSTEVKENKELVIKILKENKYVIFYLSKKFLKDDDVMEAAFSTENSGYLINPKNKIDSKVAIKWATKRNPETLYWFDPSEKDVDSEVLKEYLELSNFTYFEEFMEEVDLEGYCPVECSSDYMTLMELIEVEQDIPVFYDYVRKTLIADEHMMYVRCYCGAYYEDGCGCNNCRRRKKRLIVINSIINEGLAFQDVPEEFKNDKKVFLAAVENDGQIFEFASEEFRNDKEIILAAVKKNGLALQFISDEFKNDNKIVLAAVKKNGLALQFISDEFKNDKKIVLAAVTNDDKALEFASDEFKNNKDIVLAAVKKNGLALRFASDELKNDKDIVLAALKNDDKALEF